MSISQAEFEYNENYSGQSTDTYTSTTTGESKSETVTEPFPNYGWICPVCGRGLSPYTSVCPCKNKWEITFQEYR